MAASKSVKTTRGRRQRKKKVISDPIERELDSIKRLLVLHLLKGGASQKEIAHALQVDQAVVSRLFPASKIAKYNE